MKRLAILVVVMALTFSSGCMKAGRAEFFDVVQDHKVITVETNVAVIASIRAELDSRDDLSPEDRQAVEALIERLELVSRLSELIYEYVNTTEVDSDLISQLIRSRWNNAGSGG